MNHLENLIIARRLLARDLTKIDAAVRGIASRSDWLASAAEDLDVIQRSMELTIEMIKQARSPLSAPRKEYT